MSTKHRSFSKPEYERKAAERIIKDGNRLTKILTDEVLNPSNCALTVSLETTKSLLKLRYGIDMEQYERA